MFSFAQGIVGQKPGSELVSWFLQNNSSHHRKENISFSNEDPYTWILGSSVRKN